MIWELFHILAHCRLICIYHISADVNWSYLHIHHAPIFKEILLYTGFSSPYRVIITRRCVFKLHSFPYIIFLVAVNHHIVTYSPHPI